MALAVAPGSPARLRLVHGTPVVGVLAVAGERGADMRPPLQPGEVEQLAAMVALPLMVGHQPIFRPSGPAHIGRAVMYRWAPDPPRVVTLLDVRDSSVMRAVERGQLWGLSLGRGCSEVSLTDRPAYRSCRVLGWDEAAWALWESYDVRSNHENCPG